MSKHLQIVKLELQAVLKLQRWDELDELFDECWKHKSADHYETLANLVLVIHSYIVKAELDVKYQRSKNSNINVTAPLTRLQKYGVSFKRSSV